jgi:protein-L-isoaspartate(D-aspartate) O-methyltransferase
VSRLHGLALALALPAAMGAALAQDRSAELRRSMVAEIDAMARAIGTGSTRRGFKPEVMAAMGKVPRHRFVLPEQQVHAYENRPLPIGSGQTISQPYIVALMSDLLEAKPADRVLEIGTGSGYQAAVLAELVGSVYTVEIVPELARRATGTLKDLGYPNVRTRLGDGHRGWPEEAPFDGILVTAAAEEIPGPLLDQLRTGGRLVIPVGAAREVQQLRVLEKQPDGTALTRAVVPVRFVPMTRGR